MRKRPWYRVGSITVVTTISVAILVWLPGCQGLPGCQPNEDKAASELTIFHAGSLLVPFREISALFKKEHPDIAIKAEAAGSRDCAREICDQGRRCDVMASADYKVVVNLLMPDHADFNIRFAFNEMVIACTDRSRLRDRITAQNWHKILLAEGVTFGRTDPNRDPLGYRSLMVSQLAEKHYRIPGLARRLSEKHSGKYVRPTEAELLALLKAGEIDYLVLYRSVAKQHALKMVLLPDEVNLRSPALASLYNAATVKVTGKKPGTFITRKGEAMVYLVTIPKNAPNRGAAEAWVALLLSPRGRAIMERNGQSCMNPPQADGFDRLPESLKRLCR